MTGDCSGFFVQECVWRIPAPAPIPSGCSAVRRIYSPSFWLLESRGVHWFFELRPLARGQHVLLLHHRTTNSVLEFQCRVGVVGGAVEEFEYTGNEDEWTPCLRLTGPVTGVTVQASIRYRKRDEEMDDPIVDLGYPAAKIRRFT